MVLTITISKGKEMTIFTWKSSGRQALTGERFCSVLKGTSALLSAQLLRKKHMEMPGIEPRTLYMRSTRSTSGGGGLLVLKPPEGLSVLIKGSHICVSSCSPLSHYHSPVPLLSPFPSDLTAHPSSHACNLPFMWHVTALRQAALTCPFSLLPALCFVASKAVPTSPAEQPCARAAKTTASFLHRRWLSGIGRRGGVRPRVDWVGWGCRWLTLGVQTNGESFGWGNRGSHQRANRRKRTVSTQQPAGPKVTLRLPSPPRRHWLLFLSCADWFLKE